MNPNDIALTGLPRGGTTLACRLLGLCDGCVSLFEPMDPAHLPPERMAALQGVLAFFANARENLLCTGTAPSMQRDGQVPDNPFAAPAADGSRRSVVSRGLLRVDPPPPDGFTLVVKHNASFAALLPELAQHLRVLAIVRNPLAVLASWNTVQLPVREGRIPAAERLDPDLARRLDAEPDRVARQASVLDWFFTRFGAGLDADQVVRYEDIVASRGQSLFAAAGLAGSSDVALGERNASTTYRGVDVAALERGLRSGGGAWRNWYTDEDVATLGGRLRGTAA